MANLSKLDIRQRLRDELKFCESIRVYNDNLEVKVIGARPLNVLCGEVGFKVSIVVVGDPTQQFCHLALAIS